MDGDKLELNRISYLYEPEKDYGETINDCETLSELIRLLGYWELIAWDALDHAKSKKFDFKRFKKALKKERAGIFSGEKEANLVSPIIFPLFMFKLSIIAIQYKVPWGTVFLRMKDLGKIQIKNNRAYFYP